VKKGALLAVAGVVALALALVPIGRWEGERHADEQNDGIDGVYRAIGELDAPALEGFRFAARFECLIYRRGARRFALELCVDSEGRAIEGIDRRSDEVRIWSLRENPDLARVRVGRDAFERVIVEMCEACEAIFDRRRAERQARR
jgi:hypothetical protein